MVKARFQLEDQTLIKYISKRKTAVYFRKGGTALRIKKPYDLVIKKNTDGFADTPE